MYGLSIIQVNDQNFEGEVLKGALPVLVQCTAPWSAPCRLMTPMMEKIAADHAGRLKVCVLNIDDSRATAMKYQVKSLPLVLAFRGGANVGQAAGITSRENLLKLAGL